MSKLILFSLLSSFLLIDISNPKDEIDAFWSEASKTVAEGNFEGYAATFHKDAILVNGISGTSYPIKDALSGWKQGFNDTKAGKMKASVEFRFTERVYNEKTAHETGIFKYFSQTDGGEPRIVYIHFQGLLSKASGEWKMMMEYQISEASEEEWDSLK